MIDSSSKLLEKAIEQFASLPGVGKKTALRFVLNLLKRDKSDINRFIDSLVDLKENIHECKVCHNICDGETCNICASLNRDHHTICVVENIRDIMSIEFTSQFNGVYHVLGGIISPMEGISPNDLHIASLIERIEKEEIKEIIFALSATIEGDTTAYYIYKKLKKYPDLTISTLAKGISVGNDLEYTDEITLGRSIVNRIAFGSADKVGY